MAERSSKRPRSAPLREYVLEPIADPAERAALERKLRESEANVVVRGGKATPAKVEDLYRQLPARARLELLTRLVAELSADDRGELLARLPAREFPQAQAQPRRRTGER